MVILDTNVISELMRNNPHESVVARVRSYAVHDLYTTTITHAEILYGILLLPPGKRRGAVEAAAAAVFLEAFAGRILAFDANAVQPYAEIAAARSRAGRPISHFDAQIAAIARTRNAPVLTGNDRDFAGCGIDVINPWK